MSLLHDIDAASARDAHLIAAYRGGGNMTAAPSKVAAIQDTLLALADAGVACALIGGVAVGIHSGTPRATLDTNFAVSSHASREHVVAAMCARGFVLVGNFEHSINFRHASGEPVQLALDAAFDVMIARAEHFSTPDGPIPLVTREDLVAMKQRAAADPARRKSKRLRDQADVELLLGDVPGPDEGW